jgi:polyhydroxyalkanoate synthesis regulator phasin
MVIAANATLSAAVTPSSPDDQGGISDALRSAIESTFAATAGSAGDGRERAGELLDEVARRGRGARDEVVRRGQEAGAEVMKKGQEAGADVVARVEEELHSVSERLAKLEAALRRGKT